MFFPQFYLKSVGDGEAILRRLDDEPEFAKKVRDVRVCVRNRARIK